MATLSADVQRMRLENVDSSSGTTEDSFAQIAADRPGDILPFYEIEGQLLALWDQLNELKLEKSLLEARADRENIQGGSHAPSIPTVGSPNANRGAYTDQR